MCQHWKSYKGQNKMTCPQLCWWPALSLHVSELTLLQCKYLYILSHVLQRNDNQRELLLQLLGPQEQEKNCLTDNRVILAYDFIGIWPPVAKEAWRVDRAASLLWRFQNATGHREGRAGTRVPAYPWTIWVSQPPKIEPPTGYQVFKTYVCEDISCSNHHMAIILKRKMKKRVWVG